VRDLLFIYQQDIGYAAKRCSCPFFATRQKDGWWPTVGGVPTVGISGLNSIRRWSAEGMNPLSWKIANSGPPATSHQPPARSHRLNMDNTIGTLHLPPWRQMWDCHCRCPPPSPAGGRAERSRHDGGGDQRREYRTGAADRDLVGAGPGIRADPGICQDHFVRDVPGPYSGTAPPPPLCPLVFMGLSAICHVNQTV